MDSRRPPDHLSLKDAAPLAAQSVVFMVLRRLRAPMLVIVLVYAVSVYGFTLVPGQTPEGVPASPMSFFHALYFVSYTATTIGFGEVPQPFSEAQRLWALFVIHLSVTGWTYALLSMLALLQDGGFKNAVVQIRFASRVRRLREPFHLICGAADTGQRLAKLLDRLDMRFVVVEPDKRRLEELELEDLRTDVAALSADVKLPQTLLMAGVRHPMCRGLLAVAADDETNLAVVTAARLLNKTLPVIAGAETRRTAINMQAFGTQHVINPFDTFAENLMLAMRSPGSYRLLDWLTAPQGAELASEHRPPEGAWVICGYGRFGHAIARRLAERGIHATAIDPAYPDADADASEGEPARLRGIGTETAVLQRASIETAAVLVAATDSDINNLAIAALARKVKPSIFVVLRENDAANAILFGSFKPDLVMRPSEIIADECVALLTAPLLERFIGIVRGKDDAWADEAIHQFRKRCGTRSPLAWTVRIDAVEAPAVCALLAEGTALTVGHLQREPGNRQDSIAARAALLLRDGRDHLMPNDDVKLRADDRILFIGRGEARRRQALNLFDYNVLRYVSTGRDTPGGWLFTRRS